ncbi:uncharacterized protein PV07_00270 [Cladophialophora immunda]|uniref:Uncharacterized protein n=1 Tax=Cladophialophora immunda TaxID=569365 RepID=A0A0D2CQC9_9EURO|nr:uncharacterized protein PV07_00270 [Cladophialophora immunda]KIW33418.1 hypothetical protein PV07_00270 [Cladophialophora immunda]
MSDQNDRRPAKQRRIHGMPLLNQTSSVEDDEDSSSSSSSSSIQLPTTRLTHRLLKNVSSLPPEDSSSDGESGDDNEEETTSSSGSEDSDSEEMSEEEEEEEEEEEKEEGEDVEDHVAASGPGIPRFTTLPARASDLKSRLQSFLPQLQQANVELDNSRGLVDKRIDHVSDDAEHYIEMEVGLGVLSEQNDDATQIRLPHSSPSEEEDNAGNDETKGGQEDTVLSRLVGTNGTKGTKRKIEEL